MMTRAMRNLHLFAIGVQSVGLCFFAWAWVMTGAGLFAAFAGWCCFYGALSTHALWTGRKRQGLEV